MKTEHMSWQKTALSVIGMVIILLLCLCVLPFYIHTNNTFLFATIIVLSAITTLLIILYIFSYIMEVYHSTPILTLDEKKGEVVEGVKK